MLVAFIAIATAGGVIIDHVFKGITVQKDVTLNYDTVKTEGVYTKTEMSLFDGLKYRVDGDYIVLNKPNVYQEKRVKLIDGNGTLEERIKETIKQTNEFVYGIMLDRNAKTTIKPSQEGTVLIKEVAVVK